MYCHCLNVLECTGDSCHPNMMIKHSLIKTTTPLRKSRPATNCIPKETANRVKTRAARIIPTNLVQFSFNVKADVCLTFVLIHIML